MVISTSSLKTKCFLISRLVVANALMIFLIYKENCNRNICRCLLGEHIGKIIPSLAIFVAIFSSAFKNSFWQCCSSRPGIHTCLAHTIALAVAQPRSFKFMVTFDTVFNFMKSLLSSFFSVGYFFSACFQKVISYQCK